MQGGAGEGCTGNSTYTQKVLAFIVYYAVCVRCNTRAAGAAAEAVADGIGAAGGAGEERC